MPVLSTERTVRRGPVLRRGSVQPYHGLVAGPGEHHQVREDLAARRGGPSSRSLLHLAHLTDVQLIDAQSPSRLEAVHALGLGPETALMLPMQRPQEVLGGQAADALVRTLNALPPSPRTGAALQLAMTTGDNVDNMQDNEVRAFLRLLSGGEVDIDSGGAAYEGMQDGSVPWAWAPDDPDNEWGHAHGFPTVPGLLARGLATFVADGLRIPWLTCFGNHDGLIQGRVPASTELMAITLGHRKVTRVRAGDVADFTGDPLPAFADLERVVGADPRRRPLTRADYIAAHFTDGGLPHGHGFTASNRRDGTAYYAYDDVPGVRIIVLDTTNPAGIFEGSIDRPQFAWLRDQLSQAQSQDRLVLIASHHPRTSMTNNRPVPGTQPDAGERVLGPQIGELLHEFDHVTAWLSGHIHRNRVTAHHGPSGRGGYWEISTSSVMDWPCQGRIVELVDNLDGTLSLVLTTVDHPSALRPDSIDDIDGLAAWHRELAANDPFGVGGPEAHGTPADRNVELVLADPRRRR